MFETLVGTAFAAIGVLFLTLSALDFVSAILSSRWPTVRGRITESTFLETGDGEGMSFRAAIAYAYTVDGVFHTAKRVRFGDRVELPFPRTPARMVDAYPLGREVDVRYNPNDPAEAVLEPGPSLFIVGGIVLGVVFIGAGVLLL